MNIDTALVEELKLALAEATVPCIDEGCEAFDREHVHPLLDQKLVGEVCKHCEGSGEYILRSKFFSIMEGCGDCDERGWIPSENDWMWIEAIERVISTRAFHRKKPELKEKLMAALWDDRETFFRVAAKCLLSNGGQE